jgi:type II secretory pathway pseudopilin PulG
MSPRSEKPVLEVSIMKSLIKAVAATVALAAVFAVPAVSFAQSNQPLTRAEVRAQLVQLEQTGYRPANGRDPYYPSDIQAAEARVAAQNGAAAEQTGYGAPSVGSSDSGSGDAFTHGHLTSRSPFFTGH